MRALTTSYIILFLIAFCIHNGMGNPVADPEPGVDVAVNIKVNENGGMDSGCPEDENTFYLPSSNQCFRILKTKSKWTDASSACKYGRDLMYLAKPYNAVDLRSYMIQRFGGDGDNNEVWLDARGDGTNIVWQHPPREVISNNNPLWFGGKPSATTAADCLVMLVNAEKEKKEPNAPYSADKCETASKYPLCEVEMRKN